MVAQKVGAAVGPRMTDKPDHVDISVVSSSSSATVVLGSVVRIGPEKPPPEHPIYSYVGRVASEWAHVEHTLDQIIWQLAGTQEKQGACITAQVNGAYNRCKAIIALLKAQQSEAATRLVSRVNDLANTSNGPNEKRNRIVHDPWYIYTDRAQVGQFRSMAHKHWEYGIYPVDLEALQDALQSIKEFADRVSHLQRDIAAKLKATS